MSCLLVVGDAMLDCDVEGTVERICPEAPVPILDETGRSTAPGGAARAAEIASATLSRAKQSMGLIGAGNND